MKSPWLILMIIALFSLSSYAQTRTKSDSVMYLSPYVVIGLNPKQVQVSGTYSLYVPKGILTERVRVAVKNSGSWADYVFDEAYPLKPLSAVEKFVQQHKHLPDVPSASEVVKGGLDLGDSQRILLQKIEELTLYIIQQEKRINALEEKLNSTEKH